MASGLHQQREALERSANGEDLLDIARSYTILGLGILLGSCCLSSVALASARFAKFWHD
jgi:hypothetical protein